MNTSLTYLTIQDTTPIHTELHPSSLAHTPPTGSLTVGELFDGARLTVTFTSYGQVQDLLRELTGLRNQWTAHATQLQHEFAS